MRICESVCEFVTHPYKEELTNIFAHTDVRVCIYMYVCSDNMAVAL